MEYISFYFHLILTVATNFIAWLYMWMQFPFVATRNCFPPIFFLLIDYPYPAIGVYLSKINNWEPAIVERGHKKWRWNIVRMSMMRLDDYQFTHNSWHFQWEQLRYTFNFRCNNNTYSGKKKNIISIFKVYHVISLSIIGQYWFIFNLFKYYWKHTNSILILFQTFLL